MISPLVGCGIIKASVSWVLVRRRRRGEGWWLLLLNLQGWVGAASLGELIWFLVVVLAAHLYGTKVQDFW